MDSLFQELLPLIIVIALSPPGFIPAVLMLFSSEPRRNAFGFLAGWAGGIAAATIVLAVILDLIDLPTERPAWKFWVWIALGLLLIALGVWQWTKRAEQREAPKWVKAIGEITPPGALKLGLLLSALNPKIVVLAAAAGVLIGSAHPSPIGLVLTVLGFAAGSSVLVATPLAVHLVAGDAMLQPLAILRGWLERHSSTIATVVLLALGVVVLWKAIAGA